MLYLRGSSYFDVLKFLVQMDPDEEAKHTTLIKNFAQ